MPKIFLSSTIHDLADLRSAMKYWLEENGFEVLASEWPDFPHALDREAIAAALRPIEDCDYYVLIVGTRVGQVLENESISVTRAEFRHARELRRTTGRPQMLHLVRREVYDARHGERPPTVAADEDWRAIVSFLEEVGDKGPDGDPNWLRKFDSFRDVVDVLRATLHVSGPLARRALEANLLWETKANTRELLGHGKETGLRPNALTYPYDLKLPGGVADPVRLDWRDAESMLVFRLLQRPGLRGSALDESIHSGRFLEYDPKTSSFVVGPMQQVLLDLRQQLQGLEGLIRSINTDETISADVTELVEAARAKRDAYVTAFTVRMLYGAWSSTMNVLSLSRALYQGLTNPDKPMSLPKLEPIYMSDVAERIKEDEVTDRDAETWLRSSEWRVHRGPQ